MADSATKTCVHCKETMKRGASRCPHCARRQPTIPAMVTVMFCGLVAVWALVLRPLFHAIFG